jgi:hypothetical protein
MNVPPRLTGTILLMVARTVALLSVSGRIGSEGQSRFGPTVLLPAWLLSSGSTMLFGDAVQSLSPGYQ